MDLKEVAKEVVKDLNSFAESKKEARIIRLAIETLPDNLLRRVIVKVDGNDFVCDQEFDFRPSKK